MSTSITIVDPPSVSCWDSEKEESQVSSTTEPEVVIDITADQPREISMSTEQWLAGGWVANDEMTNAVTPYYPRTLTVETTRMSFCRGYRSSRVRRFCCFSWVEYRPPDLIECSK